MKNILGLFERIKKLNISLIITAVLLLLCSAYIMHGRQPAAHLILALSLAVLIISISYTRLASKIQQYGAKEEAKESASDDEGDTGNMISISESGEPTVIPSEKVLLKLGIKDDFTSLYNYLYFYERIGEEIKRADRYKLIFSLAFLVIDNIDELKAALPEDKIAIAVRKVARIIKNTIRETDMAGTCNFGKFCVIFYEADRETIKIPIERIQKKIDDDPEIREALGKNKITLSAGVSIFPKNAMERLVLIKQAEKALIEALKGGQASITVAENGPASE